MVLVVCAGIHPHAMTYRAIAERFGDRVVRQDYSAAWDLLAKKAQA
jgi:hypothetical protein